MVQQTSRRAWETLLGEGYGDEAAGEGEPMKIPLQDKIAELEARIAGLEAREKLLMGRSSQQTVTTTTRTDVHLGEHWSKMWDEFHLMMKDVFK